MGKEIIYDKDFNVVGYAMETSGCFLTSACIEYAGLPDDCSELHTLRQFRDEYVRTLPNGSDILAEYYETAPVIVSNIKTSPDRADVFAMIFRRMTNAVRLIENKQYSEAFSCYAQTFLELKERFGRMN